MTVINYILQNLDEEMITFIIIFLSYNLKVTDKVYLAEI